MRNIVILFSAIAVFYSCSESTSDVPDKVAVVLKQAGKNRIQLERVIDHYKETGDTLKLKAAYFLIENMPGKYSLVPEKEGDIYKEALSAVPTHDPIGWDPAMSTVRMYFDSIAATGAVPAMKKVEDIDVITADYLIRNIEQSFQVWKRYKYSTTYSFDDFCNYVLPYREGNEPLGNWRDEGYRKFGFLLDSLSSPLDIARYIIKNGEFYYNVGMSKYPYPISFEEIEKVKLGSCEHLSFYLTSLFRAIGIPTATEVVPAWANRSSVHRWNAVMDTTGKFVDMGLGPGAANAILYKLSKIYRQTYQIQPQNEARSRRSSFVFDHPEWKDVTSGYDLPVSDIRIVPGSRKIPEMAYLCTFNNTSWVPVAQTRQKDGCFLFKSVGRGIPFGDNTPLAYEQEGKGIVYLPMVMNGFHLKPVSPPFILHEHGDTATLRPDFSHLKEIRVYRKYPKYSNISIYADRMKDGLFECSATPDFLKKEIIHTIVNPPSHNVTEVVVSPSVPYRYVRYVAPDSSWVNVGELSFFSSLEKLEAFASFQSEFAKLACAFDDNIETYYEGEATNAFIGLDFGKPVTIDKIIYSPRTDNNEVTLGDDYELFYWDDRWISLGRTVAETYMLTFQDVPDKALLLLHNHSRGKEERIFTYENGQQVWW